MTTGYRIGRARRSDLAAIAGIEQAAAELLVGHAPPTVLAETTSLSELEHARSRGRLWVARLGPLPVGFAHVVVHEPSAAHLEEIDVHPDHGRRGIGRWLVETVCAWAAASGYEAVTLTTFRDVPWNMPFYARLGFDVLTSGEIGPVLSSVVGAEARRGLDPSRRVVMRKTVGRSGGLRRSPPDATRPTGRS